MKLISVLFVSALLISCATVSPLTGGVKDVTPPKVLSSSPDSAETRFYGTEIRLELDEFFTVQNLQKELIISPPFSQPVTYKIKGKTLIIQLPSFPLTQTTYQMYFGAAIKDVNEGNILKDYNLIFSTGDSLDAGRIGGTVLNSKTLKPEIKHKVILFKNHNDSNIFKSLPYYLTYTDSLGRFQFNHISDTNYQIVSLDDKNLNNKLDYGEQIGFIQTNVKSKDKAVTIYSNTYQDNRAPYIKDRKCISVGIFEITLSKPLDHNKISVFVIPSNLSKPQYPIEFTNLKDKDGITCFMPNDTTLNIPNDTVSLKIVIGADTLLTNILNKSASTYKSQLTYISNAITYNQPLKLSSNTPINGVHKEHIKIFNITDSIETSITSVNLHSNTELHISAAFEKGKEYRMITLPTSIDFYSFKNTSIDTFYIRTYKDIELGDIELVITIDSSLVNKNLTFTLEIFSKNSLTDKNNNILTQNIKKDTLINLNQLLPGEYFATAYIDLNKDEKWTDANYNKKTLPEPIFIKTEPIIVRANWQSKNISFKIK